MTSSAATDANVPTVATPSSVPDPTALRTLGSGEEESAAPTASSAEMIPTPEEQSAIATTTNTADLVTSEESTAALQFLLLKETI